jgi:Tol biopolymer transport system component/DNA-binding winged helix-turn-helix (wHTH) protein
VPTDSGVVYQFGPFEVNTASGELLKNGRRIKLQELPYRLLVALLENAGELISREELRSRLWPDDTFVDFDSSLRVAVGKLREALDDNADDPRYIETIPKRGYRFLVSKVRRADAAHEAADPREDPEPLKTAATPVAFVDVDRNRNVPVKKIREVPGDSAESSRFVETLPRRGYRLVDEPEAPVQPVVPAVTVEPDRGLRSRQMWLKIAAGVLAISVVAAAGLVAYRWHRPQRPQEQEALNALPFTALPGRATSPAFSPDGSRISFAWNGDPALGINGFDLYVKALGSETLLRLTQHPSEWISSAWSPDGTQIAFHRIDGDDTGIYVIAALGGPERKLRSTRVPGSDLAIISWSPDGKWIAFVDQLPSEAYARIYLLSMETLETRRIPISPMCISEGIPAFSHNGEHLAYWCFQNDYEGTLYSLALPDGKPKMIAPFWVIPNGLTWSADDKKLVYSRWKGRGLHELGEVTVADGAVKRLALEGSALRPAASAKGDRLAYNSVSVTSTIWRKDLLHSKAPAVELIPSSRTQSDAQYSPDGRRIVFVSIRSGGQGVWISNEDGSNVVQISNPAYFSGSPQWSPDGRKIAYDSRSLDRPEIYVVDVGEQKPRKLVTNISTVFRPHWSHDGKWIYFSSSEIGRAGIYRCPASGGDAVLLSKDIAGYSPQESFDGKTLYFASHEVKSTLKRVALLGQPGAESEVEGMPRLASSFTWTVSPGGIYFVPADAPRSVRYFDLATKQIRPILEVDKGFGAGLSVSPDGRWILYSQDRSVTGDIMLVDHFQ